MAIIWKNQIQNENIKLLSFRDKLIKQYMLQQKLDWENIYTDRMNKIKQLYLKNMNFIKSQLDKMNLH